MDIEDQIYNELRQKIAMSFEINAHQFLPDQPLQELTESVMPAVLGLRSEYPNIEYDILVDNLQDGRFNVILKPDFGNTNSIDIINEEDYSNYNECVDCMINKLFVDTIKEYLQKHKNLTFNDIDPYLVRLKDSIKVKIRKKK